MSSSPSTPASASVPTQPAAAIQPQTSTPPTTPVVEAVPAAAPLGSNGMTIKNQSPAPDVTVADVVAAKPGFIAVFSDTNGKPGALAGVGPFLNAGETRDVPVRLKFASKNGETYWAELFVDNGDKTFSASSDVPAKDTNNADLMTSFKIIQ